MAVLLVLAQDRRLCADGEVSGGDVKLGAQAENPLEQLALALGLVPTPLLDTIVALLLARSVMVGVKVGVFEALATQPLGAAEVAVRCATDPRATEKLLGALAGAGYLEAHDGCFALAPVARRWLLKDSARSLHDAILLQFLDADFIARMEDFVRTGEPLRIHEAMRDEQWELYQRGMRAGANLAAPELALRIPVPKRARGETVEMLDIGGAHGYYSVALCRRHPSLRATLLDLPEAVAHAAPILAAEGMGDRVVHRAGNALTEDLGEETYDLVLIANLVHHFGDATNRALVKRVARALRPGGVLVIGEVIRPSAPGRGGQVGALTDLYFALTSEAGTWSFAEMAAWQREAGLVPRRPLRLFTAPGGGLQIAKKPGSTLR
jgi:2-polyprenyl-3-methyl-5-hydroxy-6-metoxy-1,4-benzoquinol methylase